MSQKYLKKHIPCECKYQFDGNKYNSNQKWNNDKCEYKNLKEHYACEKDYIWNLATCSCENGEHLVSSIGDSVIRYDKILNAADSVSTNKSVNVMSTYH